ncbi:MBL fold metallo-hydrolase [Nitratireductor kimnyeongensis]|uniref:MBL fold metallo-hydrolase n=1 Tax=Nitratireductor kimnyeongensis TaxID=430679 RepID=A0ABW0TCJ4_9HYPH|nr:MBL fold metallo-hydrolase [Nitratireductor kimnyeongensis]QZZ36598.1 MBL fold metallo-hydrolase [Nitratireductor kimnyeongensis]
MNAFRLIAALPTILLLPFAAAQAQTERPSTCLAMAQTSPRVIYTSLALTTAASAEAVDITYAGHSTYIIETPAGVTIATDFSGAYGASPTPRVVTMNKAHSTHFTRNPDPAIEHVLPGWNPEGGPARHALLVDDVYIRNVTTDIHRYGAMEPDANSIFIFEVAGLCVGHLGHLHHRLDDSDYAAIGRLDVVMVPVDGGLTLSLDGMSEIARRLSSSVILPMHRHSTPLSAFTSRMGGGFELDFREGRTITVALDNLPRRPTIVILDGV